MELNPANRIAILKPATVPELEERTLQAVEKNPPLIGRIISYGHPGFYDNGKPRSYPLKIEEGDIVAYRQFGQSKFWIKGEEIIFCNFDDLLAVIKKGQK